MNQVKLRCSFVNVGLILWLPTVTSVGLRHGASREQLMKQEVATEEWFESRVDNPANVETIASPELAASAAAQWPPVSPGHAAQWPPVSPGHAPSNTQFQPSHWESAVDKKSGRTYYFDRVTNRSQWERPEGATESFPNVLPMSPTNFEDERRHTNFKMYKSEPVDLTCLRHTGIHCEITQFGRDILHSCPQLTAGLATCVGGVTSGECQCDEGYCSTSTGHCHTERSTYVPGTFTISTEGTEKEYMQMVISGDGLGYVTLSKVANDDACKWRIIERTDGTHILTTVKYPYAALDFVNVCEGDDCGMQVALTVNPEGSQIGTKIKLVQHKMAIGDTHSTFVLYFPHLKDKDAKKIALGCEPHGFDCPTKTGYLVFDPELPKKFYESLEDVDNEYWKMIGLYCLGGFSFCIMIFLFWYTFFLEVKGSRFH